MNRRLLTWWTARTAWQQALLVYFLARLVTFVIVSRTARFQAPSLWTSADPGYFDMVDNWDGYWYQRIAEDGYPATLPREGVAGGRVQQNPWAFYPLFPFLARALMWLTGGAVEWAAAASLLALILGAGAVVVLRSVVEKVAGADLALWTVVLFCFFPSAPVLQFTYTESLAVLLLAGTLWCLQRRRYLHAIPLVLLIGIARPIGVPLAAVIALHVVRSWPQPRRNVVAQLALVACAGAAAFAWPVIAGLATGSSTAYVDTMAAWRSSRDVVPFMPWWWMSQHMLGDVAGPAVLIGTVLALAWWLTRPAAACIAGDLRTWVVCYLGYLLAVLDPGTSLPRYLLLAFPLGTLTAAVSRSRAFRLAVTVAFVAGQVVWVVWLWRFVPPSDWPP